MNAAQLVPFTAAAVNLALTGFVASSGLRSLSIRVFLLWGISMVVWNTGTGFMFRVESQADAEFWARFLQFGVIFLPVSLFHLCRILAGLPKSKVVYWSYGAGILLALSNFTPFFIASVKDVGYAYYSVAGPGFWMYTLLYSALTTSTILTLWRQMKVVSPLQRTRIRTLLIANSILIAFGCNDILPILEVYRYPVINLPIFPFGSLAAIIYGMLVSYSALQHRLLNVHIALGRFTAHLVRFGFLFFTALLLQLTFVLVVPDEFNIVSLSSSLLVLLVSTGAAAFFFPKIFGSREDSWERRILGDRFEYQDQVRSFIDGMKWYSDLQTLLADLETVLLHTFCFENYRIILRDETTLQFAVARAYPEEKVTTKPLQLQLTSPVFEFFERAKGEYLSVSRDYLHITTSPIERRAREQMSGYGAEFCFPLAWQHEPFGLFLIGKKSSREPFTATDVSLLVSLAKNLSLVANQIRLKTQVMQTQELDLLGRMSRGMAHDLNNLLTPLSTLLQLAEETGTCDEELLPMALRNITTMRSYIKESLFFSEHPQPDLRWESLNSVINGTVELARSTRRKPVDVVSVLPGEIFIEMNGVLLQRLLTNLISNAIDASEPGSFVRVEVVRLNKPGSNADWVRIEVIDQGEGISRENLSRVQIPYFTTKDRGDEGRGFGLGLAICRKIVTLHGGQLSIHSQLKKGTTVQVDLPVRQSLVSSLPQFSSLPAAV